MELRKLGFNNDIRDGAPICRYTHDTLTLDVMPTEATLGFANPWSPHAHRTSVEYVISSADVAPVTIRVISAASFIATKLVSYRDRGQRDPYHRDLEDIIVVVDGRATLFDELTHEPAELRKYVRNEITTLLANDLEQHIPSHLSPDAASQARFPIVVSRLRRISLDL
jgi:hypothetical protein